MLYKCGFRAERPTIDMVFSVRQLQEKCREQQIPLFIVFIYLTEAFDLVSRVGLFKLTAAKDRLSPDSPESHQILPQ